MDVGKDVTGRRSKVSALANKVANSDFMQGWLIDNQEHFIEVMSLIKDGAPVKYAELYLKAYQMGLVKESNINININRQQDRENLQALVRSRVTSLPETGSYTSYEEVVPKPIPVIKEEEEE